MGVKEDIQMKQERIKAVLDEKMQKIQEMPEGKERDFALFEYECNSEVMQILTTYPDRTISDEYGKAYQERLAMVAYINEARAKGEIPEVSEIREKGIGLAQNKTFGNVFEFKTAPDAISAELDMLCGGSREGHLSQWFSEITGAAPVDYDAEFERLSAGLSEEETGLVKEKYIRMAKINQVKKVFDYDLGKTPEEVYRLASSPELEERHRKAVEVNAPIKAKDDELEKMRRLKPTAKNSVTASGFLNRIYFYFYDYSGSPDAMKHNQEMTDRVHSALPEDINYQNKLTVDIINKMLSIPDEKLAVKNDADAAKILSEDYYTVSALFEEQNFITTLTSEYNVPDEVVEALNHKSKLVQEGLSKHIQKFKSESGDLYPEIAMLDDVETEKVGEMCSFAISNSLIKPEQSAELMSFSNGKSKETSENNPTMPDSKYDGITLNAKDFSFKGKKNENKMSVAPKEPKKPHWFKEKLHSIKFFGKTVFYKNEFARYEREMAAYRTEKKKFDEKLNAKGRRSLLHEQWRNAQSKHMTEGLFRDDLTAIGNRYSDVLDAKNDPKAAAFVEKLIRTASEAANPDAISMIKKIGMDADNIKALYEKSKNNPKVDLEKAISTACENLRKNEEVSAAAEPAVKEQSVMENQGKGIE